MCSQPALPQIIWAEKDVRDDLVWLSHFTNKETDNQVGWPTGPTMTSPFLVLKGAGTTSFGKSFHAPPSITLSASKVCMWTSDVHSKRGRISSPEHLNGQSKGRPDSDGVDLKGNRTSQGRCLVLKASEATNSKHVKPQQSPPPKSNTCIPKPLSPTAVTCNPRKQIISKSFSFSLSSWNEEGEEK